MSFVGLSFHELPCRDVFFQVERILAAQVERGFFDRLNFEAGFGDFVRDFMGYDADAVLVAMEEIAWTNFDTADPHRFAEIDQTNVCVRYAGIEAER